MSICQKKYLIQLGEFRSLCQMKFGQGTENHIVAHLEPTATMSLRLKFFVVSAKIQSAALNSDLESLRLFPKVLLLLLVYPRCWKDGCLWRAIPRFCSEI